METFKYFTAAACLTIIIFSFDFVDLSLGTQFLVSCAICGLALLISKN